VNILAPLNSPDETEMLLANGADEIYCGLVPEEWVARYTGAIWLNRRSPGGGNLRTFGDLARVVHQAHAHSVPVFVTLNAQTYSAEQLPLALELGRRYVEEAGVDALIVADPGLIVELRKRGFNYRLHLSSVATTLNSSAVRFFHSLGIGRIILPRSLTLREIERIACEAGSQVELEVFILNDGCIFEEGLCSTTHHRSVGAFCTGLARMDSQCCKLSGEPWTPGEEEGLETVLRGFHQCIDTITNRACSAQQETSSFLAPCGLCAIPAFQRMGVASLKIVGREASATRKLASLKLVHSVVQKMRTGLSEQAVASFARDLRKTIAPCIPGTMCYYDPGANASKNQPAGAHQQTFSVIR
jgi:U32 family peptidase